MQISLHIFENVCIIYLILSSRAFVFRHNHLQVSWHPFYLVLSHSYHHIYINVRFIYIYVCDNMFVFLNRFSLCILYRHNAAICHIVITYFSEQFAVSAFKKVRHTKYIENKLFLFNTINTFHKLLLISR